MRIQLTLSGIAEERYRELKEKLGNVSDRELVTDALAVYYAAVEDLDKGWRFGAYDPDTSSFVGMKTPLLTGYGQHSASNRKENLASS